MPSTRTWIRPQSTPIVNDIQRPSYPVQVSPSSSSSSRSSSSRSTIIKRPPVNHRGGRRHMTLDLHKKRQEQSKKHFPQASRLDCLYYNRFGFCRKSSSCPFTHSPHRVAICPLYLLKKCPLSQSLPDAEKLLLKETKGTLFSKVIPQSREVIPTNCCALSHTPDTMKLPLCSFFLRKKCVNERCLFPHINKGSAVRPCLDFVNRWYCELGPEMCSARHVYDCIDFFDTGKCTRLKKGQKCSLRHGDAPRNISKANTSQSVVIKNTELKDSNGEVEYIPVTDDEDDDELEI